jgi:uncharacterized protein YaiE (UPF0345 family)
MKENNIDGYDYPENIVIEGSLTSETEVDTYDLNLDQITLTGPSSPASALLVLNFQITEAFGSGEEWTVNLYDKDDQLVGTINSADVSGFDDSGYMQLRWMLPDTGESIRAEVVTSDGAQYSDAAYKLSVTTTGIYESETQVGRLPVGLEVDAVASSSSDADQFGFYVDSGSETNTLSLTFSVAGTLTLSSSTGQTIIVSGNEATGLGVDADTAIEFDLGTAAQFITADFTADAAGSYTVLLSDDDQSDRVLDAPSVQVGDVILQDYNQYVFADDVGVAPSLVLSGGTAYALSDLIKVSSGSDYLYLVAGGNDGLTLSGTVDAAVSTDGTAPTQIAVADLESIYLSIANGGEATLGVFAQYENGFDASDSELALVSSGYLEANVSGSAQTLSLTADAATYLEGDSGTLTIALASTDPAPTIVEVRNLSGDIVFANGASTALVTIPADTSSVALSFTALANDTDFSPSETVSFVAEVTSGADAGLQVLPLSFEVTETVPQFTVSPLSQGLLVSDEVVEYQITLTNADQFTNDDVAVTLSVGSDFWIGSQLGSLTSENVTLTFGGASTSQSIFAGISDSTISIESVGGAIESSVTVGSVASQVSLSTMALTRVSPDAVSIPEVTGTTGADGFFASGLGETFNGLGGNDSLTISSDDDLIGTFNGGAGDDTLVLNGAQSSYITTVVDGTTFVQLNQQDAPEGLAVSSVEFVSFDGGNSGQVSITALNQPAVLAAAPAAVSVAEGAVLEVDLSEVFSDPEGGQLYIRMPNLSTYQWAEFDSGTKILSFSPSYTDSGAAVSLQIEGADNALFSNSVTTSVDVTVTDTNRTPTGSVISGQFVSTDAPADWSLDLDTDYFSDPDGDSLTYSVVGSKPDWITLSADGAMSATAPTSSMGDTEITVKASDGALSVTKTFALSWGTQPAVELSEGFVGGTVSVDVDALVSAYGLGMNDVAIEWQTSSDLTNWSAVVGEGVNLNAPTVSEGVPTFVRAVLAYNDGSADRSITTDPTLIKDNTNHLLEVRFEDHISQFVTTSIDLAPVITPASGSAVNLTGYGYDLNHYAADSLPAGTFEMTLAANDSLAPDVGISDVIASLRHIVKLDTLTGKSAIAADMDGSGDIGISDVISQLRQIVKLESSSGFKAVVETSDGYTDQLSADLLEQPLTWVAMGDVDSSYTLDIV